ncbi:MAG: ABC transporter substrate-binding protein [Paracoccus sp. (in: a-proteobacteria)]|nr:ABC transporter substrate-binding protein [Paracoccus sp. (in: a-proteobacteria)]
MMMKNLPSVTFSILAASALISGAAYAGEAVSFGTNWVAQAEHGGFYQAVADGTYAECGLDVTIVPGGPQVNNRARLLAGRVDFYMGGMLGVLSAVEQGIPVVSIAAMFQKDPQVILAHPGKAETFEDLRALRVFIGDEGFVTYYRWLIEEYGFTPEQRAVYTFNPAPFIADENSAQQGMVTSEPLTIRNQAGWDPEIFLLSDQGYTAYSTTIETMAATLNERPDVVSCFVDGSIKGWYNYLYGDNSAANAAIKAANPDMSDERIAYSIAAMKERGIVDSGDALEMGIGALDAERISGFVASMIAAGVLPEGPDYSRAFDLSFVNKGVGLDLRP